MRTNRSVVTAVAAVFIAAVLFGPAARAAGSPPTTSPLLGLGDPAPAVQVTSWVKGTPVATFEPGRAYVVEFWATWCGPCKKGIPHLTELAKRFAGKVTFVGVSVWEHPDDETDAAIKSLVDSFVKSMGDQMGYSVAVDGIAGRMAKQWMAAAGQEGIPTAFVVGGDGKIAWIGNPTKLGPVLEKVAAGTWDVAEEKRRVAAAEAAAKPAREAVAAVIKARDAHDDAALLVAIDKAQSTVPSLAGHPDFISMKLEVLFRSDAAGAVAYVQKTAAAATADVKHDFPWSVLRVVPETSAGSPLSTTDWNAVVTTIDPVIAPAQQTYPEIYSKYADLLALAGKHDMALFYQRKAVNLMIAYVNAHKATQDKATANEIKRQQARLDAMINNGG